MVFLYDSYNDVSGPVEVEQVTHIFSQETGFVTSIIPDLWVQTNEYASASLVDAVGMYFGGLWLSQNAQHYMRERFFEIAAHYVLRPVWGPLFCPRRPPKNPWLSTCRGVWRVFKRPRQTRNEYFPPHEAGRLDQDPPHKPIPPAPLLPETLPRLVPRGPQPLGAAAPEIRPPGRPGAVLH